MEWIFPPNGGGEQDGFNNASIDTFKGERIFSLVRETIQNSMDARLDQDQPVRVIFSISSIATNKADGIRSLLPFLSLAHKTAANQFTEKSNAARFFKKSIDLVSEENVTFFGIHDFNTTGLTGPTISKKNQKVGHWLALIKGSGLSVKSNDSALGSFGHGSKAPFAVSQIRSIFYFSKIISPVTEIRFQGKSILLSMENEDGGLTQGTGYFSKNKECDAVINSDVPAWPVEIRNGLGSTSGTSILIPFPDLGIEDSEIWKAIKISILSNFYYAIRNQNLEVGFNESEILNKKNLEPEFEKLVEELKKSSDHKDQEYLRMLKSSITIQFPTKTKNGIIDLKNFGEIEWFLRVGDEVDWRSVGVARQNGMLITKSAPNLERFSGTKPFDLFLAVVGDEGSRILRLLENPAHTAFEFDRIDDQELRKAVKSTYDAFTREIRNLLYKHASLDTTSEFYIDDLNDFFSGAMDPSDKSGLNEMTNLIDIGKKRNAILLNDANPQEGLKNLGEGDESPIAIGGVENSDETGGLSKVNKLQGANSNSKTSKYEIKDPRITRTDNKSSSGVIYFTPKFDGFFSLAVCKAGETVSEFIKFKANDDEKNDYWHSGFRAESEKRLSVRIETDSNNFKYALEIVVRNDS